MGTLDGNWCRAEFASESAPCAETFDAAVAALSCDNIPQYSQYLATPCGKFLRVFWASANGYGLDCYYDTMIGKLVGSGGTDARKPYCCGKAANVIWGEMPSSCPQAEPIKQGFCSP